MYHRGCHAISAINLYQADLFRKPVFNIYSPFDEAIFIGPAANKLPRSSIAVALEATDGQGVIHEGKAGGRYMAYAGPRHRWTLGDDFCSN